MSHRDQPPDPEPIDRRRLITSSVVTLVCFVLCLFLPAGTWSWARGWLFFGVVIAAFVVIGFYLRRVNPDVFAARVNRHEGTKGWDRWLLGLLITAMVSTLPLVGARRRAVSTGLTCRGGSAPSATSC